MEASGSSPFPSICSSLFFGPHLAAAIIMNMIFCMSIQNFFQKESSSFHVFFLSYIFFSFRFMNTRSPFFFFLKRIWLRIYPAKAIIEQRDLERKWKTTGQHRKMPAPGCQCSRHFERCLSLIMAFQLDSKLFCRKPVVGSSMKKALILWLCLKKKI